MNKLALILLMSLATVGAYAESPSGGVTMSTDPARAAAVESHAQELKAREAKETTSKPAATHKSSAKAKTSSHAKTSTHPKGKAPATHKSAAKPAKSSKG